MRPLPRIAGAAGVAVFLLLAAHPAPALAAPVKDQARAITDEIICPCSCGEVLTGCTCDTGISMKNFVETSVKSGKSGDQIMGALVAQYGEVVRGAPKAQGFNLIVWVAPFAATLVGFLIAYTVLRRWVRRPARVSVTGPSEGDSPSIPTVDESFDDLRARAEAELRKIRD